MTKPNLENCKNFPSKCAYHCAQVLHTTQHGAVLIIFPLHLQTSITAQILSIGGEGNVITELLRSYCMLEQVVKNRTYVIVDNGSTFYTPDDVHPTNPQLKHLREVMLDVI